MCGLFKKIFVIGLLFLSISDNLFSFTKGSDNILFKIDRSRDADIICYDVVLDNYGKLDKESPVSIYWLRKTKDFVHEPLTMIQNRFSYGIRYYETSEHHAIFRFVSFNDRDFKLERSLDGQYGVFTRLGDRLVKVERIYVQFGGGPYLTPVISEVILYGRDPESGILMTENIRP